METRAATKQKAAQVASDVQADEMEDAKADQIYHFSNTGDQSEASPPPEADRPLNVIDALSYLDLIKTQSQPDVYNQFLGIMKDFRSHTIDTLDAIKRVSTLFNGHPSLIQGFNTFLPQDYRIECREGDGSTDTIRVRTPNRIYTRTADGHFELVAVAKSAEARSPPIHSGWVIDAVLYFEMVKTEFEEQPVVYDQFMGLINDYKNQTLGPAAFVERVSTLFQGHRALIVGLKIFLPSGYSIGSSPSESVGAGSTSVTAENEDMDIDQETSVSPASLKNPVSEPLSQSLESSLSHSDSMVPLDDIGITITWISPTPIKVNGHFCDVFEGTHLKAGKIALKRPRIGLAGYDEVVVRRFEREAATWGRLRHPHILEFLGTFKRDGHMYFVSPFIDNGTLVEHIAANPDINRIRLLCETADAVQYLHQEGIVHGDLKASNILIGDDGSSLLCDFGLTKPVESRTSTAMQGAGTFRWQGPELWDNTPKSFKSDVYAFGMTIAEVLTGEVPFSDLNNQMAVMYAVMLRDERPAKTPVVSSRGISYENVWNVAAACWPRKPDDRISMLEALHRIQTDPSLEVEKKLPCLLIAMTQTFAIYMFFYGWNQQSPPHLKPAEGKICFTIGAISDTD